MRDADLRVVPRADGKHEVQDREGEVLALLASHAEAWRWIDRHSPGGESEAERHYRIRQSPRFS